jgi:hypothetical protein
VKYTFSPQKGAPGHCFVAQVWKPDGTSLVEIESTEDPEEATATARLIADALNARESGSVAEMVEALRAAELALSEFVASDCAHCGGEGSWKPDGSKMLAVAHKSDCAVVLVRAALAKAGIR